MESGRQGVAVERASSVSLARRVADWSFWGYLGLAVSALLFQGAQSYRFGHSVARARLCIAQQDSTCVSRELEVESAIRRADPRVELAAASLSLLLHRPIAPAQATADRVEAAQSATLVATPAELRADLLLLRSDIALAASDLKRARESLEAARALVGESELTALRLRRIENVESDVAARNANGLEGLRQSFANLFDAAEEGNRSLIELRQAPCSDWIARVTDASARRQLILALQAAGRANSGRYTEPSFGAYRGASSEPPSPPSKGSDYDYGYGAGTYEERMQRYRERLARYEKEQSAIQERERLRALEATMSKRAALDQAKEALAAAVAMLSAAPTPFVDSAPPNPGVGGSRSFGQ